MISVVIPTYNRATLLRRAVESVLKQHYNDFELIVVSDGSTDDTDLVMQEYVKRDKRIKYIHYPEPKGANHARNNGVEMSHGEYIAFLDDDDEWYPSKLNKQLQVFFNDKNIGLVYSAIDIIQEDLGLHYLSIPKGQGNLSKEIMFHNYITTTSSVMVKRSVFEMAGGFDETLPAMQDYDLWIRCLQITRVGYVDEPLIHYYISSNSNQISSHTEKYVEALKIIDHKYNKLLAKFTKKELQLRDANKYANLAKRFLKNRKPKECRYFCLKSFRNKLRIYTMGLYIASFLKYDYVMKIMESSHK